MNIFPGCPSTAPAPPAARRGLCYRRVVPSALRRCRAWDKLRGREKRWREITIYRLYDIRIWYDIHDILHVWMLYWWYMMYLYGCISTCIYIYTHSKPEIDRQVGNLGIRRYIYIYISSIPSSIRMQPGVCFEAERNVLTGGRLVFLVETNVSRRQKRFVFQAGFVFQAETNVLVLSKLGTGSSGKRKQMFSSKN